MKYPITPDYLTELPDWIVLLYEELDDRIIEELCNRLGEYGQLTGTDLERIRILQRRGLQLTQILQIIQEVNNIADAEFRRVMDQVVADNQRYYDQVMSATKIMEEAYQKEALQMEVEAISQQMQEYFGSVTGSLGFAVQDGANIRVMGIGAAYQQVLNAAEMDVYSGFKTADQAVREAVKKLSDSGVQWVDYKSGHHNRVDVAVRRAVQTGASQITAKYSDHYAQELGTPYVEVSAHRGARDKDGKTPWANHKAWQGKVYSLDSEAQLYPSVYAVCGLGEVDGLVGANCRHMYYPWLEGISERNYTDEELKNIDGDPIKFEGKEYNAYAATQKQRQLETEMRKLKREMIGYQAAGDQEAYTAAAVRLGRVENYYRIFSKEAGLPMQLNRAQVQEFGSSQIRQAASTAEAVYREWAGGINARTSIKTLAEYYNVRYNDSPRYELLQTYASSIKRGYMSPLVGFGMYEQYHATVERELVGVKVGAATITGQTDHFLERVFGCMKDPKTGKPRNGTALKDVIDCIKNPKEILPIEQGKNGRSFVVVGNRAKVSINPDTGELIQTNRWRR